MTAVLHPRPRLICAQRRAWAADPCGGRYVFGKSKDVALAVEIDTTVTADIAADILREARAMGCTRVWLYCTGASIELSDVRIVHVNPITGAVL